MVDPPPYPNSSDTGVASDHGSTTGTPRWVKVFGIVVLVLVALVAVMMAAAGVGGHHGPGRHMHSGGAGEHTPPAAAGQRP